MKELFSAYKLPYYLWGSWTTASCFMVNNWIFQNIIDHHYDSNWRRNRILFETRQE